MKINLYISLISTQLRCTRVLCSVSGIETEYYLISFFYIFSFFSIPRYLHTYRCNIPTSLYFYFFFLFLVLFFFLNSVLWCLPDTWLSSMQICYMNNI